MKETKKYKTIQKRTLQCFFNAFKYGEMLLPKQIIQRSGLTGNTVFHALEFGMMEGFIGKQGRRYFVKFPETSGEKQPEMPADWAEVYKFKLQQVAKINKVTVEQLPDWVKDMVKAWISHDALWYKKLQLDDLMIRSPRQKLDDEKAALQESPEKMRCMRLTRLEKQWKEVFDKWVLRQLKQGRK